MAALFSGKRWYRSWCTAEISDYTPPGCLQEHVNSLQEVRGGTGGEWPGMEREKETSFTQRSQRLFWHLSGSVRLKKEDEEQEKDEKEQKKEEEE